MLDHFNREYRSSIIVSATDQLRLTDLAMTALDKVRDVAEELLLEIERATVVPTHAVPTNVVKMDSTVEFSTDEGVIRRVALVFPGDADIAAGKISILTPIGAALIGLSEGQSIAFTTRDGRDRRLIVLSVKQAPAQYG